MPIDRREVPRYNKSVRPKACVDADHQSIRGISGGNINEQ